MNNASSQRRTTTTTILWAVFISLLAVLLPHTAWAFRKFEPNGKDALVLLATPDFVVTTSDVISYVAAFAFEAAIAVLVHKLAEHLEKKLPKSAREGNWAWLKAFAFRYLNPIAIALIIVTAVSALANLAHAVEYGQSLKIFENLSVPPIIYTVAFGAILPVLSLTFARVLSNVTDEEAEENPEVTRLNSVNAELRKQLRESELRLKATEDGKRAAEERARATEEKFSALGELVKGLFGEEKRQRILAAAKLWGKLPQSAIAIIAETTPSHVSETLKEFAPADV